MNIGKKTFLFFCLCCVFLLSANFVLALELHYPDILGHHIDSTSTPGEFFCYFFALGMDLAFFISVIVIAYGGIYYLIAVLGGKFTSEAKEWIKAGITGLLIVACSALIAYTINPSIGACKLDFLPAINFNPFGWTTTNQPTVPVTTYDEIPIGTLTENLLTRTTDCYGFDQRGNPVDGDPETEDILEPTYLNHDRADCLVQLTDGAQKRAQVIANLSNEIIRLMSFCECAGKCDPVCNPGIGSNTPTNQNNIVYNSSPEYATASLTDAWTNKNTFLLSVACSGTTQSTCPSGQHCSGGVCVAGTYCTGQANCPGQHCDMSTHVCAPGKYCTGQANCPGQRCENNVCVGCTDDSGCATNEVCSPDGTCVPEEGGCIDDWDCADDEFCSPDGTCVAQEGGCIDDWDCAQDETCSPDGTCVPEEGGCIDDWDCADDEFCSPDGTCVAEEGGCIDSSDCGTDETCLYGTCVNTGGGGAGCGLSSTGQPFGVNQACTGSCSGPCVGGACKQPSGTQDCCPDPAAGDTIDPLTGQPLAISYKQKIEHGPIEMSIEVGSSKELSCRTDPAEYAGLDEFRCPNPIPGGHPSCDNIKSFVETQTQINGRTVTIINKDNWIKLNLIQRLTYFKEKIEDVKKEIEDDKEVLDQARIALKECYSAISGVDFLKIFQGINKQERIILKNPGNFSDPITNEPINASRYCAGFNYANSSCFKKCNDACPDTSQEAINLYQSDTDIADAHSQKPCIYGADTSQTFGECISSCQFDCEDACSDKYLECSDEHDFCINQCGNNSHCILDNADTCLFRAVGFSDCASRITDQGNTDYCIDSIAYSCKNGSDQYAGYPDCAEPPVTKCSKFDNEQDCQEKIDCIWNGEICSQNYSASFFYDNPNYEKCYVELYDLVLPSEPADESSACYADKDRDASCQNVCPEVSKCPASSSCLDCPCDQLSDPNNLSEPLTLYFSSPGEPGTNIYAGNTNMITEARTVSAHQMVGPQCNEYSYSDDPLTFYCEDVWWENSSISNQGRSQNPIGQDRVCPTEGESPMGQVVDNSRKWADKLISDAEKIQEKIQGMLDQMTRAGDAYKTPPVQDYCKCNAKLENNKPICQTNCRYDQREVRIPIFGGEGIIGSYSQRLCNCKFVPCNGQPCQQIIDYLSEIWDTYRSFKEDFIKFYITMLQEPRSDIMKQLAYSRKMMNTCSVVSNTQGAQAVLLNCTRVEDQIVTHNNAYQMTYNQSALPNGCYGGSFGEVFDLTDNWFCCQLYNQASGTTNPTANTPTR